jgi:hypothetical protein
MYICRSYVSTILIVTIDIIFLFTDGSLMELDTYTGSVYCDSKALNSFHFDARSMRFIYTCSKGDVGPDNGNGGHRDYTAWTRGADKGLNYLDRHFIKCPEHEFITFFNEERHGVYDIRFEYGCEKWSPAHDYQCHDKSTEWNIRGSDNTLIYLDRHNVQCGANEGLDNFRVQSRAHGDQIKFDFRCCSMKSVREY